MIVSKKNFKNYQRLDIFLFLFYNIDENKNKNMFLKRLILFCLVSSFLCLSFGAIAFAEDEVDETVDAAEEISCLYDVPEEKTYDAEIISVRNPLKVEEGEIFTIKVFVKNSGAMPWFSDETSCKGPIMFLGTTKDKDRASSFYDVGLDGWAGDNRVRMDQYRIDPGGIASFTFEAKLDNAGTVYKEYFAPVVRNITWLDDDELTVYSIVGDQSDTAQNIRKKMDYAISSGSVNSINLNAEKSILVDLSDQMMYIKLGDSIIREFRVSTGAAKTPTPIGETHISLKQEVRVAHKSPHYIMPKFQMFRYGGYGLHSLPSLGSPHAGVFWTEARSHIGIPVSHGCIRLLPEDAEWLFDYTEVGNKVVVQY